MHCLDTLKKLNSGKAEINRSLGFSPPARATARDTNPKKDERDELHPPLMICPRCDKAIPEDLFLGDVCEGCYDINAPAAVAK